MHINPKWLALAAEMLDLASEQLSANGCNDWQWPDDWTTVDRHRFALALVRDNNPRMSEEAVDLEATAFANRNYGPPDWWVCCFLAHVLKKTAKEGKR